MILKFWSQSRDRKENFFFSSPFFSKTTTYWPIQDAFKFVSDVTQWIEIGVLSSLVKEHGKFVRAIYCNHKLFAKAKLYTSSIKELHNNLSDRWPKLTSHYNPAVTCPYRFHPVVDLTHHIWNILSLCLNFVLVGSDVSNVCICLIFVWGETGETRYVHHYNRMPIPPVLSTPRCEPMNLNHLLNKHS